MAQFHETGYGRAFFEHQLPELTRQLKRVADQLRTHNECQAEALALQKESKDLLKLQLGRLDSMKDKHD